MRPVPNDSTNIRPIPISAPAIAIQVRSESRSRINTHAASAAVNGERQTIACVFATVVNVSASKKNVIMVANKIPDTTPTQPTRRNSPMLSRPCVTPNQIAKNKKLKQERQNTTSQLLPTLVLRTMMPDKLQQTLAPTIKSTPNARWFIGELSSCQHTHGLWFVALHARRGA
jgi:hypothetical protein